MQVSICYSPFFCIFSFFSLLMFLLHSFTTHLSLPQNYVFNIHSHHRLHIKLWLQLQSLALNPGVTPNDFHCTHLNQLRRKVRWSRQAQHLSSNIKMGKEMHMLNMHPRGLRIRIAYSWVPINCFFCCSCFVNSKKKTILSKFLSVKFRGDILQNALRLLNNHTDALSRLIPDVINFVFYEMNIKNFSQ